MTQLLGPKPLRALLFVETLNAQGAQPTKSDVNAFIEARTNLFDFDPYTDGLYPRTVDYLIDARLLTYSDRRLTLTSAGTAILRAAMADSSSTGRTQPIEVVGRMTDPFVYAELLARIDDVSDALVIDPYLHPSDLAALLRLSNVRRILTRDTRINGMTKSDRAQKLKIALGAHPETQLRFASAGSRELHDRLILPARGGEALILGTSLGGTQLTVVTRIGEDPTSALRTHYNSVWDGGGPVEPITREPED